MFEQRYKFFFEAAHQLGRNVAGDDHPYAHVHGHSFEVTFVLRGQSLGEKGWLTDFAELRRAAETLRGKLDHRYLNDIEGLELPTLENLARFVFEEVRPGLDQLSCVSVARPSLGESVSYQP
jgi:6-pyruvoyltetrahydropterin/6-carboxytetrahydropterin synthase